LDVIGTPSLKSYRTATTLCVPDLVFNDISRHKILLPEGTPVQREILAGMSSADEQFHVAGHAVQNSNVDFCFYTLSTVCLSVSFCSAGLGKEYIGPYVLLYLSLSITVQIYGCTAAFK